MKIFLNAGHGGKDPGAVSNSGTQEKDVCKIICAILAERLVAAGYDVETFQEKYNVFEVSAQEKKSNSDIFVSIHCNSFNSPAVNGIETLFYPSSVKGKILAQRIQEALIKEINLTNRGIKPRTDLHVLKSTSAPAVLVECAFLSNEHEEKLLLQNPDIFANGIFKGIINYFK